MSAPFAEVIGDPVEHSRSPRIHRFWLQALGIKGDYRATRVTRAGLAEFIASRRSDPDWRGCNVTMPLKLDALLLADRRSDRSAAAGAANLLFVRDGELNAANTDIGAVARLLGPLVEKTQSITLLGNGGAARAVLVALRLLDFNAVRIQSRDLSEARKLAVEFGSALAPAPFDSPIAGDGLVNATPLGMTGHPPFALDLAGMPAGGWVMDMVTDPDPTALLTDARARGLTTIDGLTLLVEQAGSAFELLFGRKPPRDRDGELMLALRP